MNAEFDPDLLARIEDAGINASAPREQLWIDGWLVRFAPGKAKRARCIQAVAPGRRSIDTKLALCLPVFAAAGLRPYVRITPFSEPEGLDARLDALGMERIDDTRVMALADLGAAAAAAEPTSIEPADPTAFAEWIGRQRGSPASERRAHADRLVHSPVPPHAVLRRSADGTIVAGGQLTREGEVAGIYDVFTAESARQQGHAAAICRDLLRVAQAAGARVAYLQVDAANDAARRLYVALGFVDAYAYHYRSPPAAGG